jgi:hypothetical protein
LLKKEFTQSGFPVPWYTPLGKGFSSPYINPRIGQKVPRLLFVNGIPSTFANKEMDSGIELCGRLLMDFLFQAEIPVLPVCNVV